jgi:hypothetical protein
MPCRVRRIPVTTDTNMVYAHAIICSARPRRRAPLRCSCCGQWETTASMRLCDAPEGRGTCAEPVCTDCATHVEPDTDYCQTHRHLALPAEVPHG